MISTAITKQLEPRRMEKEYVAENDHRNTLPRLKKTARDFESMLYQMVFKSMRQTIQKNPLFHGGSTEDTFQELADLETSKAIVEASSFGLADAIVRDYKKFVTDTKPTAGNVPDAKKPDGTAKGDQPQTSPEKALTGKKTTAKTLPAIPDTAKTIPLGMERNSLSSNANLRMGAVAAKKAYASAGK